jgi:VWFA-related protein
MQRWTEPVRVACRAGRCGCPAKGRRTRPAALTACLTLACVSGSAQEGREPPASDPSSFTAEAAAVTVDVVVLDDRGRPVTGLEPEDFEIREDGRRQAIVGFEARDLTRPPERASSPNAGVTNVGAAEEQGRVMALLIDDLGISAPTMAQLAPALARWIEEHALERDEITILTTSGDRWWSDAAGRGRADLAATLESVTGKRLDESGSPGWISEWEAYEIGFEGFNLESQVSPAGRSRPHVAAGGLGSTLERVVRRHLDAGLCNPDVLRPCYGMVQGAALQVLERWRRRAETVFGAVARLSRSLAGVPGRKGVLLVTEEFVDDRSIDGPFRSAIEATQRANVAVYFLAARGLAGSSLYSAASRFQPRAQDVAAMVREEAVLATGGGEALAETTGGAVTRSNDLAAGLERMARESSAYYMLGYQPEEAPDGRWRDLEVKVAREGVRVRARRSYRASRPDDLARPRRPPVPIGTSSVPAERAATVPPGGSWPRRSSPEAFGPASRCGWACTSESRSEMPPRCRW